MQQPKPNNPAPHNRPLFAHIPSSAVLPSRTNHSTPITSPGLFSPTMTRHNTQPPTSWSESNSPGPGADPIAPYLHPLQTYKVRETTKALIESDNITGRKLINQYEVIEEIGRGMHGKVKLARNIETGENVAIKIIPRFSKKRRLGKVTAMSPQDKTKKEIAILKKIRHPNVVALLEVIDDPELKKIYMVLEHAELGEVVWRKKGLPHICQYERRRAEREARGDTRTVEEERYDQILEQRQVLKEYKRARMAQHYSGPTDYWSNEYGAADEPSSSFGQASRIMSREDFAVSDGPPSQPGSRQPSRGPSRSHSLASVARPPSELDEEVDWEENMETPGPIRSNPNSHTALDGMMYAPQLEEHHFRGRSPSMADSIISHMSSVDMFQPTHDAFADDFSYVPCFTMDLARSAFRDTLLGLEYLHYQGVVHRDIKPANLLWSKDHRVKISDFGVSYFGRPIRDGELDEPVSESEAKDFDDDVELSKTVGTPAFFAPELCYTDEGRDHQPKVSEQIDVWSLGVTLYCLIFARIPFLAEDEFQMFRKIATEEVYIPHRRLKPVDPSTSPVGTSLYKRHNVHPYRNDNDLDYEQVDPLLWDLLRRMLTKNPEQRIKLRDIKRHQWVMQGIENPVGWLDDTDPGRPSSGRKIEINDQDVSDAVVPLTFLERLSRKAGNIGKAVTKAIHPLVDRSDSKSRRRATSSVASSAGDSMVNGPPTQHPGSDRRRSVLPDDYFLGAAARELYPGAEPVDYDPMATVLPPLEKANAVHAVPAALQDTPRTMLRHARSLSKPSEQVKDRRSRILEPHTTPSTPLRGSGGLDEASDYLAGELRWPRTLSIEDEDNSRSRSVDRGLFGAVDKRGSAQVGVSQAVASGDIQRPAVHGHPRQMRSVDLTKARNRLSLASPLSSAMYTDEITEPDLDSEPARSPCKPPLHRKHTNSNPESFVNSQGFFHLGHEDDMQQSTGTLKHIDPASVPHTPSPDSGGWDHHHSAIGGDMTKDMKSSSTDSMACVGTPCTVLSEVASPVSGGPAHQKRNSEHFQSDPSLPALLSGASSVSADMEAELLGRPGVVSNRPSLLETTDSLAPPVEGKEGDEFPLSHVFGHPPAMASGSLTLRLEPAADESHHDDYDHERDDDGSGSDDGILLMASRKKPAPASTGTVSRRLPAEPKRRDTNISTTSVETARPPPTTNDEHAADGA
ncbi:putative serine/threonine protein kinase [Emericellopsis atlantica]|uniref:non-specific serine/threonine protein kinase n=1 Tax=Emericellopsis atlantica TaxID=2614577 RepID=A0A9P7ZQ03_9HYPO|nr:putative serine/threonine protein kinase [Emericellopsis atlantica]KAG9256178.1 putative serine/threonine protein kinase [Emericellopsis atlantica]